MRFKDNNNAIDSDVIVKNKAQLIELKQQARKSRTNFLIEITIPGVGTTEFEMHQSVAKGLISSIEILNESQAA